MVLTPNKPVPRAWFGDLKGRDVLCLAGAGGQQAPVFAAAGARVTVLTTRRPSSGRTAWWPSAMAWDAARGGRHARPVRLRRTSSFDLIFHPCSNCFVDAMRPVWREAYRVLRPGGALLSGFCNPVIFLFDPALEQQGVMQLKYKMPYSDFTSLTDEERARYKGEPLVFAHSLEDQIGGQLDAGFAITGFYEDKHVAGDRLSEYLSGFIATRAVKLATR